MVKRFAGILTFAIALLMARSSSAQGLTLSVMEMLDQYEQNQALVVDALARIEHVGSIEDALKLEGEDWVNANGAKEADQRRLIAASFALEAAAATMEHEWLIGARMVEWGCDLLRKQKKPLPAERLWHRAALALIEGAYDLEFLTNATDVLRQGPINHLKHMAARFPDDPAIVMAHALVATQPKIQGLANRLWDLSANAIAGETSARLLDALKVPSLAPEAHVRLAYLDLMANRHDTAFAHLADADRATQDPQLKYLSALFAGWAYTRQKQSDNAIAAFRRAVATVPNAQTGVLALAAQLYGRGDRQEASELAERMLTIANLRDMIDPWLLYGYGDYRLLPQRMAELREAIR